MGHCQHHKGISWKPPVSLKSWGWPDQKIPNHSGAGVTPSQSKRESHAPELKSTHIYHSFHPSISLQLDSYPPMDTDTLWALPELGRLLLALLQYATLLIQLGPLKDEGCEQKTQHQLHKGRHSRDVFKCMAQCMQAQGHDRDSVQCWAKTKWMKVQYKYMHDANKKSGNRGHRMPFSKELSCFLHMYRAIATLHMYGITGGQEELLAGTPSQQEVQEGLRITEHGAQEKFPGGFRAQGLLLAVVPKDFSLLVLVPESSQNLEAEFQL